MVMQCNIGHKSGISKNSFNCELVRKNGAQDFSPDMAWYCEIVGTEVLSSGNKLHFAAFSHKRTRCHYFLCRGEDTESPLHPGNGAGGVSENKRGVVYMALSSATAASSEATS